MPFQRIWQGLTNGLRNQRNNKMALLTIDNSKIGITQKILKGVEKMSFTKTSDDNIKISENQSTSSEVVYAFNPIVNTFVEIDPRQIWFWSSEWLDDEIKAGHEFDAGNYEEFDNVDDFIDSL